MVQLRNCGGMECPISLKTKLLDHFTILNKMAASKILTGSVWKTNGLREGQLAIQSHLTLKKGTSTFNF